MYVCRLIGGESSTWSRSWPADRRDDKAVLSGNEALRGGSGQHEPQRCRLDGDAMKGNLAGPSDSVRTSLAGPSGALLTSSPDTRHIVLRYPCWNIFPGQLRG
jgi:hypothetical protein